MPVCGRYVEPGFETGEARQGLKRPWQFRPYFQVVEQPGWLQWGERMKIIINCDDLGASTEINECVLEMLGQRRVTSATLMMNAPAVEAAARRIGKYPESSFGVHLNLTEFSPLSAHPGLRPLLNDKGEFSGVPRRHPRDIPLTSSIREGVYAEWCAQMDRALALGIPVSHVDSHHHVHTRPSLLKVLKRVVNRFGIHRVRLRHNVSCAAQPLRASRRVRNFAWNFVLRNYVGAKTTDGFASFSTFHERLRAGVGWRGTIELMCHPGGASFAEETELLRGDWQKRWANDVQLISYREIE